MRAIALALALAAATGLAPGAVRALGEPGAAPPAHAEQHALSLDEAVELVQHRFEARVVRAEETREGEETVYRIRLLGQDGHVFTVHVNARTGHVE
ncbi:MAG: PepSY domain-containing protein [Proteobacteria bacterium]|nr:PepSY domain-containing protein [Pseudomonadota bacterium]